MRYVNNFVNSERQPFSSALGAFLSSFATVPFSQSDEGELDCCVKEGDVLSEGQLIARQKNSDFKLHSPIPGRIEKIQDCALPNGKTSKACIVKLEGEFSFLGKKLTERNWNSLSSEEILLKLSELGVVNTFCKPLSLANQIKNSDLKKNRFVVFRMFDEDPSRMTDSFIAENYTREVILGCKIIAKAFDAEGVILIMSEKAKFDFNLSDSFENFPYLLLKIETSKYPCGFAENLVELVKKSAKSKKVKIEKNSDLDFSKVNHKCIFIDSETAYSAWEALAFNKPVLERFVHFTGNCLKSAAMFKVKIGTPVKYLVEQCGDRKSVV